MKAHRGYGPALEAGVGFGLALTLLCLAGAPAGAEAPERAPVPLRAPGAVAAEAGAGSGEAPEAEPGPEAAPIPPAETGPSPAEIAAREAAAAAARAAAAAKKGDADERAEAASDAADPTPPEDPRPAETAEDFAACLAALDARRVAVERLQPIEGDGFCGAERPVMLEKVGPVTLEPPLRARCAVALATARWIDDVAEPLALLYLNAPLRKVAISADYQCRKRRGGSGTDRYSEHAFANAVDVHALVLEGNRRVTVSPRDGEATPERAYQAGIRGGACAYFTTVLGPTTNEAHDDHLHFDLAQRPNGFRLCE
ncbi:MAG: extensin family protein [Pseudomonadota bacterium]